jgi:predicted nucleic acid-binding protein
VILVDSSVWVDHIRQNDSTLSDLLAACGVLVHPFVIGEIGLGSLRQRDIILDALRDLPQAVVAADEEVHAVIDRHRLFGIGIGYVDVHLLAATLLTAGARLWTRDTRLHEVAIRLGVAVDRDH